MSHSIYNYTSLKSQIIKFTIFFQGEGKKEKILTYNKREKMSEIYFTFLNSRNFFFVISGISCLCLIVP